jgi:hypothetical protein
MPLRYLKPPRVPVAQEYEEHPRYDLEKSKSGRQAVGRDFCSWRKHKLASGTATPQHEPFQPLTSLHVLFLRMEPLNVLILGTAFLIRTSSYPGT